MGTARVGWAALFASLLLIACGGTTRNPGQGPDGAVGGADGQSPNNNAYVDQIQQTVVDKMDLLLVVDNSISMGDKQALLAEAMPRLVERLVSPRCVRDCTAADNCTLAQERDGIPVGGNADALGICPQGRPELKPLQDLHVGVITSSLGSHGAAGPRDVCVTADDNDHAHLLGQLRGLPGNWNDAGFLAWDAQGRKFPAGDKDAPTFVEKFTSQVKAAGEIGCGYEGTLEAWYRFLIDPEPPSTIVVNAGLAAAEGIDQEILSQRADFLRPDSVVLIVMLTDENDCSIVDEGLGWNVATSMPMFRSTSQCLANPNDACCQSCADPVANDNCPAVASDSECQKGATLASGEDDLNLRCWQQKRRFGVDLLYPIARYTEALRSPTVSLRSTGQLVPNPLFAASGSSSPRDRGLVFLAGIVGAPWQDLADEDSLTGPGLRYLTASELDAAGRWDVLLGDPDASPPRLPSDTLMVETPDDRTTLALAQENPITQEALVPASSTNPRANSINGHEQQNLGARDLQYACTFPLTTPRTCDQQAFDSSRGCDCFADDAAYNRPLCQPPGGGATGTTQYYAKAYPGLRHLQVLKELGDNAIVASTCPKVVDTASLDYGYNPAIDAIVGRVREAFKARCLPRPLAVADDGRVSCTIIEVLPSEPASCDCEAVGRVSLADRVAITKAVREKLRASLSCGSSGAPACESMCQCELPQLSGVDLVSCQNDPQTNDSPGFCYLNAMPNEPNVGNPALVQDCSQDSQRLLRFVGDAPTSGAIVMISCEPLSLGER